MKYYIAIQLEDGEPQYWFVLVEYEDRPLPEDDDVVVLLRVTGPLDALQMGPALFATYMAGYHRKTLDS